MKEAIGYEIAPPLLPIFLLFRENLISFLIIRIRFNSEETAARPKGLWSFFETKLETPETTGDQKILEGVLLFYNDGGECLSAPTGIG